MDYTNRIKSLLAKAQHASTPRAEAEVAAAMAAKLMLKHGIDEATARAERGTGPEEIIMDHMDLPGDHGTVLVEALAPIVFAMGGQAVFASHSNRLTIVGTDTLLDSLASLLTCLTLQMVSASNKSGDQAEKQLRANHPKWSDDQIFDSVDEHVWDYTRGFGKGVADKILARRGEVIDESPGNALVLQTEADRTKAAFARMFPNVGALRPKKVGDWAAQAAGRAAGRKADLGDGRVTGNMVKALS
jgi:hypothetical protein